MLFFRPANARSHNKIVKNVPEQFSLSASDKPGAQRDEKLTSLGTSRGKQHYIAEQNYHTVGQRSALWPPGCRLCYHKQGIVNRRRGIRRFVWPTLPAALSAISHRRHNRKPSAVAVQTTKSNMASPQKGGACPVRPIGAPVFERGSD